MIAKESKKSADAAGPIRYMLGGEKDEPQQVTIVACSEVMIPRSARRIIEKITKTDSEKKARKKEVRAIARTLAVPFDRRAKKASSKVMMPNQGYIISFAPEDREKLSLELQQEILKEFLQSIGVHGIITVRRRRHKKTYYHTKNRTAMFIAVGHTETNCYHWHLFASRIDSDGLANETSFEHRRIVKACREISKKHDIRMDAMPDVEVTMDNVNPGYYRKRMMRQAVEEAKNNSTSFVEFEKELHGKGILTITSERGICFEQIIGVNRMGEARSHIYSGTQLGKESTYPKIIARLQENASRLNMEEPKGGSLTAFAKRYSEYLSRMEKPKTEASILSDEDAATARKEEILSVFQAARTVDDLRLSMASHSLAYEVEYIGNAISDIIITSSGERPFKVKISNFGKDYYCKVLVAYKRALLQKPLYKEDSDNKQKQINVKPNQTDNKQESKKNNSRKGYNKGTTR